MISREPFHPLQFCDSIIILQSQVNLNPFRTLISNKTHSKGSQHKVLAWLSYFQSVSGLQLKSLNWLSDLLNCNIFSYQGLQCSAHLNCVQLVEWGIAICHYFRIEELHDKNLLTLYLKHFKLSKKCTVMIEMICVIYTTSCAFNFI